MEPASGHGWAGLQDDGSLEGEICLDNGYDISLSSHGAKGLFNSLPADWPTSLPRNRAVGQFGQVDVVLHGNGERAGADLLHFNGHPQAGAIELKRRVAAVRAYRSGPARRRLAWPAQLSANNGGCPLTFPRRAVPSRQPAASNSTRW